MPAPFALSLSKLSVKKTEDFDKLSPNGPVPGPQGAENQSATAR